MTPTRALALLLLASCATASKPPASPPEPAPAPSARTTAQPTRAPADTAQQPKIVQANVLLAPRAGALAPRTGVMAPEAFGRVPVGEIPPLILVPPPEAPETPEQTRPPETTKPPPPVIVNPPKVDEREPEEAGRQDRPPKPNKVTIADKDWQPSEPNAPRYLPCSYEGLGGSGAFRPEKAPAGWIRCSYICGRYLVELFDVPAAKDETGKPVDTTVLCRKFLKRAEYTARSKDEALRKQGK